APHPQRHLRTRPPGVPPALAGAVAPRPVRPARGRRRAGVARARHPRLPRRRAR
ncbi:MAG: hypothetical protein AVDCRST_MAG64-4120, partial [uncultured Phycisphaerae bacterium]